MSLIDANERIWNIYIKIKNKQKLVAFFQLIHGLLY